MKKINKADWTSIYCLWKYGGFSISQIAEINQCSIEHVKKIILNVGVRLDRIKRRQLLVALKSNRSSKQSTN